MARKKAGHSGGHGWFVTFADLMALLMAFFVMLTAFSTQDQKKLQIVAGSMREAFGSQKESRYAGIIEADGMPVRKHLKNAEKVPPTQASEFTTPPPNREKDTTNTRIAFDRAAAQAIASLRQALQNLPEILDDSKNVVVEETANGLDIRIVDQDGRSMFGEGETEPFERTRKLFEALAGQIREMPNAIRITGHSSAQRRNGRTIDGWRLSTGRALAVRDILSRAGVPPERFESVSGRADTDPMFPDDPTIAANRRVSIVLIRAAPPVPAAPISAPLPFKK